MKLILISYSWKKMLIVSPISVESLWERCCHLLILKEDLQEEASHEATQGVAAAHRQVCRKKDTEEVIWISEIAIVFLSAQKRMILYVIFNTDQPP